MTTPPPGSREAAQALEWLARNTACELAHHYGEEDEQDEWRVYRVTGNRSDREWTVIGSGGTPLKALISARGETK